MPIERSVASWPPGVAPVAVVIISLNEGHNMEAVCQNLSGWAQEVFLVDSYSQDDTVDIALRHGLHVIQHRFQGYAHQWNFALSNLPIQAPWTMKLDPDERLSEELKESIIAATKDEASAGVTVTLRLFFMRQGLPVRRQFLRVWRTDRCRFSDVSVNEHPIVNGKIVHVEGELEHHDSPDLDHWLEKQNRYTTAEAIAAYRHLPLADLPRLMGTPLQRRMWLKKYFHRVPGRYFLFFLFNWLWLGAWRVGWVGYAWARLRSDVMRFIDYKRKEMEIAGQEPAARCSGAGQPDSRVRQYD